MTKIKPIFVLLLLSLMLFGCIFQKPAATSPTPQPVASPPAVAPQPAAGTVNVDISGFAFSPSTITVDSGTTVTWTNKDSVQHSATSDNGAFDTGIFSSGESKSFTFTKSGTYNYHCSVHTSMRGTVIVR
ncbi:MAG: amidase [Nanoarchaeota archaeon]|nr:MAG: amidase [Nanoarchaeota archaeon]